MERVLEIIQEQLHLSGITITEDLSFQDDLGSITRTYSPRGSSCW